MTLHSTFVRSLLPLGSKLMATAKGAWDVRTIGAEIPDTEVAVILGVDTHLETSTWRWPWTIWAEKPGRVQRANDPKGLGEAPPLG